MSSPVPIENKRIPGRATPQGTLRYAARFQGRAAAGHFREAPGGLVLSSVGIGTYLGEPDEATDKGYADAVVAAVEGGINVVDSAINYRLQRSERSIGAALKHLAVKGFSREEIVLCTKAGFLTPDGEMPDDANEYFSREFIEPGIFRPEDIAAGCHCMAPRYLADQLDRSRRNLGVECVDVFYLHNPETQLSEIPADEFRRRISEAFQFLESAVAAGKIGAYGLATWNCFREDPKSAGYLSLAAMEEIAREVGGAEHHFRFVQLPLNLAMPEALLRPNQVVAGKTMAMVQAARAVGVTLVSSAALLQGQLTKNLPPYIGAALGLKNYSAQALQFARSVPGVTTALVGMSRVEHVRANLEVIGVEPAPRDQFLKLFEPPG
ncbi:MAG TPA: aldo/keto reductase [Candidatus Acidoferrales bacterium]|nr:aldo/keto reductase [Candidatus Acidoferrales bacterium]